MAISKSSKLIISLSLVGCSAAICFGAYVVSNKSLQVDGTETTIDVRFDYTNIPARAAADEESVVTNYGCQYEFFGVDSTPGSASTKNVIDGTGKTSGNPFFSSPWAKNHYTGVTFEALERPANEVGTIKIFGYNAGGTCVISQWVGYGNTQSYTFSEENVIKIVKIGFETKPNERPSGPNSPRLPFITSAKNNTSNDFLEKADN